MTKRMLSILLVITMSMTMLVGCSSSKDKGGSNNAQTENNANSNGNNKGGYELALITDVGTIDDKSFNQGAWEGIAEYANKYNKSYKYYVPTEKSDDAIRTAINLAVKGGAKIALCSGYLFETALYQAQAEYPDVDFIILDGEPRETAKSKASLKDNTVAVYYAEEQAGFLAGYAAVKDGYRKLGFMGGISVPAVVRYGYGFVQGADYAAKELGLKKNDVNVRYTYVGNFNATPENQTLAASWYKDGVEVIFGCGGGVGNSVMKAAETAKKNVIGVDVDQSTESATVVTSAMKNLTKSVYDIITQYYDGKFPGGQTLNLDATTDSVQLPLETSKFKTFTQDEYDTIYKAIVDGNIKIGRNDIADDATKVPTEVVKVNLVK